MSTPLPEPDQPHDLNEPPEEQWRPETDRDGNDLDENDNGDERGARNAGVNDDGEYDQEEREDGGTEVSGRGHPDEPGGQGAA